MRVNSAQKPRKVSNQVEQKNLADEIKKKIIRSMCFYLYSTEESALMNYICYLSETQSVIREEQLISQFADAEKSLSSLLASRMIVSAKENKKEGKTIMINQDYFNILPAVCEQLLKKLETLQKRISENSEKVTCKRCGKKREKYTIGFVSCDCQSTEVIIENTDTSKMQLEAIGLMISHLNQILAWKDELDEKKKEEAINQSLIRQKQQSVRKVTNVKMEITIIKMKVDELMRKEANFESPWKNNELKKNSYFLKETQNLHAPRRKYQRIQQLQQARKRMQIG